MKNTLVALALLLALAAPVSAEWVATASTLTWETPSRPTADMQQLYDAMLWKYRGTPLDGLFASAAYPKFALTDLGGGNSKLSLELPLAVGNNWVLNLAAGPCPTANTTALRRACVDPLIKNDLMILWRQYRAFLRDANSTCNAIIAEPPAL